MTAFARGCVRTPHASKFGSTRTIAEVPIVDPGAFYEADLFVHSWIREFLHSLGRKRAYVQPIPAYSHVLVDFAFWQTKEPSDQEPVIAIQNHANLARERHEG